MNWFERTFILYSYESTSKSDGFSNQDKSQLEPVANTKSNVSGNPIVAKRYSALLKILPGLTTDVLSPGVTACLDVPKWLISDERGRGSTLFLSNPQTFFDLNHHLKDCNSNTYGANSFSEQFFLNDQLRLGYDEYDLYETPYI